MNRMDAVRAAEAEMTEWRRAFHAAPELGFEESGTAARVAALCRGFGLEVTEGVGGTGVVATLRGTRGDGRAIGLRAELDALPMQEASGRDWCSGRDGISHACGHDGHMAMLLGAARALAAAPDIAGTVRFIFQPAEEGLGGARAMLADGLFDRFPCDEIYAAHNCDAPLGQVIVHHGPMAAAADRFEIVLEGQGGHGAEPHRAQNPLPAAARLLLALESLPARVTDARRPAVLTVGAIRGGEAFNAIPDRVRLAGTIRALDEQARATLEAALRRHVAAQAEAEGLTARLDYASPFAVTRNSDAEADHVIAAARDLFGAAAVTVDPPPEMGSEDFGFMLAERPGCCFLLGQGDDDHRAVCHDPRFDFNDRLLTIGAALWVRLVERRTGCV
ncbi:amidohydrolase [Psychromarinibacter sp. C21-152]|uniref:Amidohydrolase n=1 Tax=Psychromarinibacter sediminicola TaxID=3033385 RepID=A0AAE3NR85_9RHOB|nr:amidohydrolase [Psychromarinibacter sediminicola]MDF0600194.1 amidohydrolase [Psychromarinibacter sediminicola]